MLEYMASHWFTVQLKNVHERLPFVLEWSDACMSSVCLLGDALERWMRFVKGNMQKQAPNESSVSRNGRLQRFACATMHMSFPLVSMCKIPSTSSNIKVALQSAEE